MWDNYNVRERGVKLWYYTYKKIMMGHLLLLKRIIAKSELFPCDYYTLLDNISKEITYQALANLIVEKFGCKKLILDF